jgi:hypothetical protein
MQDWRMVRELPARQWVRSTTEAEVNFTDAIFEDAWTIGTCTIFEYQHHRPWVGGCLGGHTERVGRRGIHTEHDHACKAFDRHHALPAAHSRAFAGRGRRGIGVDGTLGVAVTYIAHITNAKVWAEGTFESGRVLVLTAPMYPMLNESPFHMYVLCAEAKPIVAAAMKALSMLAKWTWEVVWFWGGCCRCKQRTFPKHCNF